MLGMNKKSLVVFLIFAALAAKAQDYSDQWESDPLDVLEMQNDEKKTQPQVPEFQDIDDSGGLASPFEEVPHSDTPTMDMPPLTPAPSTPTYSGGGTDGGPDYSQEAEFHRIYKNFNEQPTSTENWEKVVGARESEVYLVQKGDTLSGISSTFFGDFGYWPKLWSLNNPQILNPHEIEPGMNIKFYPGTMDEAPTLSLAAAGEEVETGKEKVPGSSPVIGLPKAKAAAPVLKGLPPSLPKYKMGHIEKTRIDIDLTPMRFPRALEHLEFFISDRAVIGSGKVTGTEMNMKTAGDYQYIYVELNGSSEKFFVAQKNLTEVSDPLVKDRKGQMVEIQGEIEVLERVSDQKNVYRAIVRKTISPIEVGSVLVPGRMPMIDPIAGSVVDGVGAKIMGGQFDRTRTLFGSNSLVFLDAGANQGLQEGQTLRIYADEKVRNKKTDAVINDRVIGTAKIVRTSPNFATAYVVTATDNILLGDYLGSAKTQARLPVPASNQDFSEDFESDFENLDTPSSSSSPPASDSGFDDSDLDF